MWPNPIKIAESQIRKLKSPPRVQKRSNSISNDKMRQQDDGERYFTSHKAELEYLKEFAKRKKIKFNWKEIQKTKPNRNSLNYEDYPTENSEDSDIDFINFNRKRNSKAYGKGMYWNKEDFCNFDGVDQKRLTTADLESLKEKYLKLRKSKNGNVSFDSWIEEYTKSNNIKLPSHRKNYSVDNELENAESKHRKQPQNKLHWTLRLSKAKYQTKFKRKNADSPPVAPISYGSETMFVYLLGDDNSNSNSIDEINKEETQPLTEGPEIIKSIKNPQYSPSKDYYKKIKQNFSPNSSFNKFLSIEREKDYFSYKQIRDFPKVRLSKLIKK
ncbi:unnamed protein product [Blepharisma stoltei]|uniref:Uncharacterized protein n=1 Tax=Blepharisma stoltei TaxID=1481888 RepID=A0AAU9K3H0_9CILI|nr:unnamed protein product [Blepharisma stoltei]